MSVDLPTHLLADAHRRQQADPLGQLAVDVVSQPGLDVQQLIDERPGPLDGDRPVGQLREGAGQVAAEQDGTLDLTSVSQFGFYLGGSSGSGTLLVDSITAYP